MWEEIEEIKSEDLCNAMSGVYITEFYHAEKLQKGDLTYYVIVGDNGGYFKHGYDLAVSVYIEGQEMPKGHGHEFYKDKCSSGKVYLDKVFCVLDEKEMKRTIDTMKKEIS